MNKYLPINNNSYQHQTILHNTQLANSFVTYKFAVPKLPNTRKQRTVRQVLAKVSLSLPGLGFCGQYCKKRTFFCPCACPYVGIVIFTGKVGFFACNFNGMGADHQVYSYLKCLLHNNRNTRPKEKIDADYRGDQGNLTTTSLLGWPCAEFQLLRLEAPSIRRESASFTKSSTHRYASEYQALAQALADPRCIPELWSPRIYLLNVSDDKPCAPRQYPGKSVGCVCNNTYCDEITRDKPTPNHFVAYTSSEVI